MYPKTKLTKPVRRGIMLFLIVTYLVTAPIIVFYTAGYRYDFTTNEIKQTGVLSVDVKPENTQVYLNNVLIKNGLPIYLPNRAPGSYKIRLSLLGHKDWEKDILIESKKTTYIKNVTLFKESLSVEIMKEYSKQILDVGFSPTAAFSLVTSGQNGIYEVDLVNLNDFSYQTMLRIKAAANKPETYWSPFNDFAFIKTITDGIESIVIFDANNSASNKTYNFTKESTGAQWSTASSPPTLYIKNDGQIISLNTETNREIMKAKVDTWYVESENSIWLKTNDKELTLVDNTGKEIKKITLRETANKILSVNSSRIITQDEQNTQTTQIDGENIVNTASAPTQNIFFNQKTREWLTWSPWELWTIYEDGKTALLNRTGEKMNFALPLDDYGLLLLASENKITGFNPGYYVTHELLNDVKIGRISADTERRMIFFFGEVAGKRGLFELEY